MAIEIKQLLIKSTVLQEGAPERKSETNGRGAMLDPESLKEDILADCRNLLLQLLREQKER